MIKKIAKDRPIVSSLIKHIAKTVTYLLHNFLLVSHDDLKITCSLVYLCLSMKQLLSKLCVIYHVLTSNFCLWAPCTNFISNRYFYLKGRSWEWFLIIALTFPLRLVCNFLRRCPYCLKTKKTFVKHINYQLCTIASINVHNLCS